ncbi:MAG TPA: DUF1330 domain-containing protein [Amycolatopsis sp.]|nr:DUF1330 domain-containing protein [Amycolatopsis sp.]
MLEVMSAYVISEVEVLDEELATRYRTLAEQSIERFGGRYLVRGQQPEVLEGDWASARRLVIVEFSSMERARAWYDSPEYAEALKIRSRALDRRLIFAEGLEPRITSPSRPG